MTKQCANDILGGAATCSEGFEICFLKVPLACLGSMAAAVQPSSLGTLRKHFTKPSEQVAAPPSMKRWVIHLYGPRVDQSPLLPPPQSALVQVDERHGERPEQDERGAQVKARLARPGAGHDDGRRGAALCRRGLGRPRGGSEGRVEVHWNKS